MELPYDFSMYDTSNFTITMYEGATPYTKKGIENERWHYLGYDSMLKDLITVFYDGDGDGVVTTSDMEAMQWPTMYYLKFDSQEEEAAWFIEATGDEDGIFTYEEIEAGFAAVFDEMLRVYDEELEAAILAGEVPLL